MSDAGVCQLKPEFILEDVKRSINLEHVSERDKSTFKNSSADSNKNSEEPLSKKQRFNRHDRKKLKGQNKSRGPTFTVNKKSELCVSLAQITADEDGKKCERPNCNNLHDVAEYLKIKPTDIGKICYSYEIFGKCVRGLTCRFGQAHITSEGKNKVDQEKFDAYKKGEPYVKNQLNQANVQFPLRKRTYNFDLSEKLINFNDENENKDQIETNAQAVKDKPKKTFGSVTDEDIIKLKNEEKKKIDWNSKLYLSPLTTVGNLPFRRICKEYGADITCGEMAMCSSLLQGHPQEWALVKRHKSEDVFGVQLCANNPHLLTKCGQLLEKECDIDFVDLNLGCPIDLVFKQGGGSGLINRKKVLKSCVRNLSDILTIPMTVKIRTGVYKDENVAHLLAPQFRDWGASAMTVHGRSKEQRYTKSADWQYIRQVAQAASPLPVYGNGDILSYEDFKLARETAPEISGIMIGRGALIKPWIFTEIKEKKLWDISSSERFDIVKKYVNYGLEHWGSDTKGVENTRRFLLEWLSFLYRYIPIGILEHPPQKINQRPPFYKGRDELETLMASPSATDWIRISEMFLGPVPEGFSFLPKHKANSYQ